jgi:glycosyltransferase involved in cell wall biosynthesis
MVPFMDRSVKGPEPMPQRPQRATQGPAVSVVVPFLDPPLQAMEEALASVLGQSFQGWELLLVDDGSGREATEFARSFAGRDPGRIRVLEHPEHGNRGTSASRNLGLRHASAPLVAFLDSDDVWVREKLQEQVEWMDRNPQVGMLWGKSRYWWTWSGASSDADRDFVPDLGLPSGVPIPEPRAIPALLRGDAAIPCPSSVMVRTAVAHAISGFEESFTDLYDDQAFYAKVALHSPVLPVDRVWDLYRQRPGSIMASAKVETERASRRRYLSWLRDYMVDRGRGNVDLLRLIDRELWAVDHPLGGRMLRRARKLRRWAQGLVPAAGVPEMRSRQS